MPLSDREQRILEEIEKNLYEEDPRFARATRRTTPRFDRSKRARLGGLLFVIGLGFTMINANNWTEVPYGKRLTTAELSMT